jgi:2-alkyl-3-oxoalkanoate reductase
MRVFVAGATGAIGSPLVATLLRRGHEVTGTTRSVERAPPLEAAGATAKVVDALDRGAVKDAVAAVAPDVIVHELTAIPPEVNLRRFDTAFANTNRLRTEGTDHLIAAAEAAGVRRFVAQSFAPWPYARRGSWVKTEEDPLDDDPPAQLRRTVDAIRYLEHATLEGPFDGLALRYGWFYGPGSGVERTGPIADAVRRRRFPIVGSGEGMWSFIHLVDAAEATALAVERGAPGIYNVTDDEPATVRDWLPAFADAIGAPPPRHVPVWLGRLFGGELSVTMMTELRGISNEKAKRELGWQLTYPSWEQGFRDGLGRGAGIDSVVGGSRS